MPQRTFPLKTGRTFQVQADDFRPVAQRRRMRRAGRTVNRHHLPAQCRRQVHQPAVVAHDRVRQRQQIHCLRQIGFAAQIDTHTV